MPTIKIYCDTGFANASHKDEIFVDDEDWDALNEEEKNEYLLELSSDFAHGLIDYGAYVVEEDDE